jgi:hypothetical protein
MHQATLLAFPRSVFSELILNLRIRAFAVECFEVLGGQLFFSIKEFIRAN